MAVLASRNWCGGGRCRFGGLLVPPAPLPLTTARVGAGALVVFGDYQIAPIAARSTAMGRWRLTPPGYGGRRLRAGTGSFTPLRGCTSSAPCGGTFPSRGRLERCVIQGREPPKGKAYGSAGRRGRRPLQGPEEMGPSETKKALAPGREIIPAPLLRDGGLYAAARRRLIRPLRGHLSPCGSVGPRI